MHGTHNTNPAHECSCVGLHVQDAPETPDGF
jgi:hypothetical protein